MNQYHFWAYHSNFPHHNPLQPEAEQGLRRTQTVSEMRGQAGKHIIHERGYLLVRRVENLPDAVDERGNNQGKRMIERDVRKLVHDGVEQITEAALIRLHPVQIHQKDIPHKDDGNVRGQGVIRQTVILRGQLQDRFAGLEEHLDAPSSAVQPDDLRLFKRCIRGQDRQPVLPVRTVPDAHNLRRNLLLSGNHRHVHAQQIAGTASALPVPGIDLLDVQRFAAVPVVDLSGLLHHGDDVHFQFLYGGDLLRIREPGIEQHIVRPVSGFQGGFEEIHHDLRTLLPRLFPMASGEGPVVLLLHGAEHVLFVGGGQKTVRDGQERISVRPAVGEKTKAFAVTPVGMVIHLRAELGAPVSGAGIQRVIHNEGFLPLLACQRAQHVRHSGGEKRGETFPMDLPAVPETIDGVFREFVIPPSGLHLPVHAPVRKDVLEDGKKEFENGYALLLLRAAAGDQFCDAESPHERRNCLGGLDFVRILCYNSRGMNPFFWRGCLSTSIIPDFRGLCHFFFTQALWGFGFCRVGVWEI